MPIVYGKGGCIGRYMQRAEQPLKTAELPEGVQHGRYITWKLYGCCCEACAKARNRAVRKTRFATW